MGQPQERINASRITPGTVIAVEKRGEFLHTTRRRTNVLHATVIDKQEVTLLGSKKRGYSISTDMGYVEPCQGIQTFPLISLPTVTAGAPDASALVVGGTVVAMVEHHDVTDVAPAGDQVDPGQLWNAYQTEYALADAADGPAPVGDDMKPRTETFRGRKLRTAKGPGEGQITATVNGQVVSVTNGRNQHHMNDVCRQLRRDVIAADERRVIDPDAYPAHWYQGAPVSAGGPATVAWKQHSAREQQAMREEQTTCTDPYGHTPGIP